jgi:hypothetical protein
MEWLRQQWLVVLMEWLRQQWLVVLMEWLQRLWPAGGVEWKPLALSECLQQLWLLVHVAEQHQVAQVAV